MFFTYEFNSYSNSFNKWGFTENVLIMGDSHIKYSLNPKDFYSAKNISQESEPYYITFLKLKRILSNNSVDTLLLGFSYHNISTFNDRKLISPKWSTEMFKRIYPIYDFDEIPDVEIDKQRYVKTIIKKMCLLPKWSSSKSYIGSFSCSKGSNTNDYQAVIKRHYFNRENKESISSIQINYLYRIIDLCDENNMKCFLISTPVTYNYYKRVPKLFVNEYSKVKELLYKKSVIVIDKSQNNYSEDYFLNSDHLNCKGANQFTKEIIKQITENLDE